MIENENENNKQTKIKTSIATFSLSNHFNSYLETVTVTTLLKTW